MIFHHFNLNLLIILALLLQTRSVSKTAQRLGLSQSSVSRSLAELRRLMGDPLLIRSNNRMELTQRGEELAEPVQAWLSTTSTLLQPPPSIFDPVMLERRFRVATTDHGVLAVLSPVLPRMIEAAPLSSLDVVPFSTDMLLKLGSGELDFIVTEIENHLPQARERHLFSDRLCCVFRADHPLAQQVTDGALALEQYLAWPHISLTVGDQYHDDINVRLGKMGARRRTVARLPYVHVAPLLLESSWILTLPTRVVEQFADMRGLITAKEGLNNSTRLGDNSAPQRG